MKRESIPAEVRQFVIASIPSVSFLESLLQLRANVQCAWSAEQLAKKVYVSEAAAEKLLAKLHADGFTEIVDTSRPLYRYAPHSDGLRSMVDLLARAYSRHLVEISRLIHDRNSSG